MKLLRYAVHNVLKISDVNFDLEGRHLFLVGGPNAQGKTSALNALLMALCGRSGMDDYPEVPLKKGEKEGWVKVELSGDDELHEPDCLNVELFVRRKPNGNVVEEFRVTDSAGDPAPEPRALLKRLFETKAFNPMAFEKLDRKAKRTALEKLLGLDFAQEKAEHKRLYDERTAINRQGVSLKATLEKLPRHDDAAEEAVSTADLMAELDRRQAVNDDNAKQRKAYSGLQPLIAKNTREYESKVAEISRLNDQISKLRSEAEAIERGNAELRRQFAEQVPVIAALKDEDTNEVRQQIKDAGATNAKVADNRRHAESKAELDKLRRQAESIGKAMSILDEEQKQRIAAAQWPVEGLSFDDDGVILDGLPFEQASKAQRVLASVRIGMAMNPKLRLLVCQDGNALDDESLATLETMLAENDFQMLVEYVANDASDEARCAVVIHDGKEALQSV